MALAPLKIDIGYCVFESKIIRLGWVSDIQRIGIHVAGLGRTVEKLVESDGDEERLSNLVRIKQAEAIQDIFASYLRDHLFLNETKKDEAGKR